MAPKKAKPSSAAPEATSKEKGGSKDKSQVAGDAPTGTKVPEKPPGHIEMKPFQRLPKEILHNHCQKHKMPKPHYEQRKASKGFYKTECILANPKDTSKTMKFLTNEEFPYKNHSENFSALLALHHLEPTRPYEKLFPSPFKEAWMALFEDLPQQQQQQPQKFTGTKKPSAKVKLAKRAASLPAAAEGSPHAAPAAAGMQLPATAQGAATAGSPGLATEESAKPPAGGPASVEAPGKSAAARHLGGTRNSSSSPCNEEADRTSSRGADGASLGVLFPPPVHISSAHKYASEFEKQQAAETMRLEKVKINKQKELQRLEEEAQMPTVFMAESVRSKVASVLRDIMPHAAAAAPHGTAAAAVAAAAAGVVAGGKRASQDHVLLPLQWTDGKWLALVCHALRRHISTPRAASAFKTRLLKELTGTLQFEGDAASPAVEACLALMLSKQQQQQQQQPQQPQERPQEEEATALDQVLESCQDFIAINTTDEASLPPHFSPAGKQIEIRCQALPQQQDQEEQEQQSAKGMEINVGTAKEKLRQLLRALTKGEPDSGQTNLQLAQALWCLCCSTGLYAVAAAALQHQQSRRRCAVPAADYSNAFAAVVASAASVVAAGVYRETQLMLQQLMDSPLLSSAAVLQQAEAIKRQELEAAESLLPNSLSMRLEAVADAPVGFYLRVPIDEPTAASMESCLRTSLGIEDLQAESSRKKTVSLLTLHILSPPGALYPLEAPVVWVSAGAPIDISIDSDIPSPYEGDVGAILCGAFATHNATRLYRPLQQLCEGGLTLGQNVSDSFRQFRESPEAISKVLHVLSSSTCETSISDTAALMQAAWQFEALLDELVAKDQDGHRGMHCRWLAVASQGPTPAESIAATGAAAAQGTEGGPEPSRPPLGGNGSFEVSSEGPRNQDWCGAGESSPKDQQRLARQSFEGFPAADLRLCREVVDSVKHPASAAAMTLPVREHFNTIREFMANPERQVLVVQGETGAAAASAVALCRSGKTTQLPRMLLEAAAEATLQQHSSSSSCGSVSAGEAVPPYIVCTQPRRLAAVSVASRVASEMGVPVGGLVGYHVRLQSRSSPQTRLQFCTHGVLLSALRRISVVVVDEVHERCAEVDVLLLVLAKALASNKYKLKVVVMSASLSVELFVAYFRPERLLALRTPSTRGNWQQQQQQLWQQHQQLLREKGNSIGNSVMSLRVPGRTYPVSVLFLSEVLQLCGSTSLPASYQSAASTAAAIAARYRGSRPPAAKIEWREQQQDIFAQSSGPAGKPAMAAAAAAGAPVVALPQLPQLVAAVVRHLHLTGAPCVPAERAASTRGLQSNKQRQHQQKQQMHTGTAIIVFCCGMGEVSAVCRAIEELQMDLWVLPCHASLHPAQQQKVFSSPPRGLRKVVVATNIAETSITIADVGYVIDCGTHKMLRYDAVKRSSKLQEEMITQANAQQRAGRAGRVTEGLCLRLYEREEFDAMQNTETPELHRQALDNVCLQLKAIFPDEPLHSLFDQCLDPPVKDHIDSSIRLLIHLGALEAATSSEAERLTSLGFYLSHFPMNIAFAKMLILAAPLGCLEETTALCALMGSDSDLYVSGADAASERNKRFARSQSDFVTNLKVFSAWKSASALGRREEEAFCSKFGVNSSSMQTAEELQTRFRRVVKDVGLTRVMGGRTEAERHAPAIGRGEVAKQFPRTSGPKDEDCEDDSDEGGGNLRVDEGSPSVSRGSPELSSPAQKEALKASTRETVRKIFWHIKACVVGGLYPQVATIQAPRTYTTVGSGTLERAPEAWQMKFFTRVEKDPNVTDEEYLRQSTKQRLQRSVSASSLSLRGRPKASVLKGTCEYDTQWVAYLDKIQTSKVFIKDVSTVSVFALLLLSCCEISVSRGEGALWLDGWLQLRCAGIISSYVKHLKGLFNLLLNEFYELSVFAITHRAASSQAALDYDALALKINQKPTQFVFFGTADAVGRRNKLTDLVKRLVELEGHLL